MNFVKKITTILLGTAMGISMNSFAIYADSTDVNQDFDTFLTNEFKEVMESDYTTMHYTTVHPEKYNIEKPEVNIGTISTKDEVIKENQESLDALHQYDYDQLNDTQKVSYKEYEYELTAAIEQAEYMDLEMLFEPSSDVTSNLITNMTEFVLRDKDDAQDYLTVLKSIPDFLDKALEITKEQSDKGIFLTDSMLDELEEWLDGFVAKTDDNALIVIYTKRVNAADFLTDEEKQNLIDENKRIVLEQIIPAYQKVRDTLEDLRGTRRYGDSVYDLPNGEQYYQAALKTKASSDKSMEELLDICTSYLKTEMQKYQLLQASGSSVNQQLAESTPEEVLQYLESELSNQFPSLPSFTYHAEYLDESVAVDSVIAYYMQCPVDDATENSIKVNKNKITDSNSLYDTLAHEGIAGHMYQRNYYMSLNPNPLRVYLGTLGYTEGWAMYAENEMWNYALLNSGSISMNQLNTALGYAINAATDLMVNGLGYSNSKVKKYYSDLGFTEAYAESTISYVEEYPLMLIPYGIGLAYFSQLRTNAETSLGSSFDALEFNKVLLDNGDRNFNLVESDVTAYINSKNPTASASPVVPDSSSEERKPTNWVLFGSIGVGVVAIGVIAFIASRKFKKDDPFGA